VHATFNDSENKQIIIDVRDTISKPMTIHDLYKTLQPLVILDGHTLLLYKGEILPKVENPLFPFETIIFQDRLYVKTNLSNDSLITTGSEILKINGESASTVVEKILNYVHGEKKEFKVRFIDNMGFAHYYRLVYGNFSVFNLEYKNKEKIKSVNVKGANRKDFPKHKKEQHVFDIIDDKIAYLKVGKFRNPHKFLSFIDSAFTEINNRDINNLIIDKTRGGGFTDLADSLFSYFVSKPYCNFEKQIIRISDESKEYIEELSGKGRFEGDYFIIENKPTLKRLRHNQFNGKVYILTGPRAYSSATLFVAMAKCYSNATIVGEETGQPLISNASICRQELPNSKIFLFSSFSTFYMPCAANKKDGVMPDIKIEKTLNDLLYDNDKYLKFTIEYIKQQENK
jgi:C-terminal processing protease CtpA/Prc